MLALLASMVVAQSAAQVTPLDEDVRVADERLAGEDGESPAARPPRESLSPPAVAPSKPLAAPDDAVRLKRFFGALTGATVSIGALVGLSLLLEDTSCSFCGAPSAQTFVFGLAPLLGAAVATGLHSWFGGNAGLVAALVGATPGLALNALWLLITGNAAHAKWTAAAAVAPVIGGTLITSGLIALALEVRSRQIEAWSEQGVDGSVLAGRFFLESFVSLLFASLGAAVTAFLVVFAPLLAVIIGATTAIVTPFIAFGVHRASGGRGSSGAALLGFLASGVAVGAASLLIFVFSPAAPTDAHYSSNALGMFLTSAGLAIALGTSVGLELSHSGDLVDSLRVSVAPVREGAMVMAGARF